MRNIITTLLLVVLSCQITSVSAGPEDDLAAFRKYFHTKFPDTDKNDFINGVYSIHPASRAQWEEIEEFPPYEIAIEEGEAMWNKPFANGKTYQSCFKSDASKLRAEHPYFDTKRGEVMTLELALNECRQANNEKPLKYKKGKMAALSAYLSFQARGQKTNVTIPNDAAKAAYEDGKEFYYRKRGQLNFSCMDCHGSFSGMRVRADTLSPALGHTTHFPVYRSKWGGMGTLHRRISGCNKQVRAKPLKAQSKAYRNLEYFLTYMNNGLELNGPGARK